MSVRSSEPPRLPKRAADPPPQRRRPARPVSPQSLRAITRAKREDALALLPMAGIGLLASPLLNAVEVAGGIGGIPAPVAYIFGAWLGLILVARRLARRLDADQSAGD